MHLILLLKLYKHQQRNKVRSLLLLADIHEQTIQCIFSSQQAHFRQTEAFLILYFLHPFQKGFWLKVKCPCCELMGVELPVGFDFNKKK